MVRGQGQALVVRGQGLVNWTSRRTRTFLKDNKTVKLIPDLAGNVKNWHGVATSFVGDCTGGTSVELNYLFIMFDTPECIYSGL